MLLGLHAELLPNSASWMVELSAALLAILFAVGTAAAAAATAAAAEKSINGDGVEPAPKAAHPGYNREAGSHGFNSLASKKFNIQLLN